MTETAALPDLVGLDVRPGIARYLERAATTGPARRAGLHPHPDSITT
ncbi:hypothetical protein HNP84_009589 [Thermocatellispora tengchongensis]|uniref:Uncharacterized protein n=1 Tax=Thermocatellispora tengchongensis TaxID=1073253 RepID=A0A840PVA9_9ACTN|nr:hypothetical protein [Thermocatellispora tengchongensis]MBB5139825.1 hypothetical protein [Thermocatellispora tengchongensis]